MKTPSKWFLIFLCYYFYLFYIEDQAEASLTCLTLIPVRRHENAVIFVDTLMEFVLLLCIINLLHELSCSVISREIHFKVCYIDWFFFLCLSGLRQWLYFVPCIIVMENSRTILEKHTAQMHSCICVFWPVSRVQLFCSLTIHC